MPRGRVTEIYGPESSGKTTLALQVIAEAQRSGGMAAFVDAEHALDAQYAQKLGVDLDNLLVSQPDNGEQALEIVEVLVRSNSVDVVVVDSVAALVPKAEIDGEMGDAQMGLQARLMSQALRKLTGIVSKSNTTLDLHQSAAREDRRHVRESGNDDGRSGAEVLCVRPHGHPTDCQHQGWRSGRGRPNSRQGREEQGGAAIPGGRVRRDVWRRHLARRRSARSGRGETNRRKERRLVRLFRRAARVRDGKTPSSSFETMRTSGRRSRTACAGSLASFAMRKSSASRGVRRARP